MAPKETTWDEIYSADDYVFGTEPNEFLKEEGARLLTIPSDGKVLCLACGEGRNAVWLAQQGYQVTAVDKCAVALEKAQKLAKEKGVEIETICSDLYDFKFEKNHWHCIVAIFAHIDVRTREKIFNLLPYSLKTGGYFILEGYTPRQLDFKTGGPETASVTLSKELLEGHFEKKLSIVQNVEKYRDIHEGKYHCGKSAVVDFVARRRPVGIV